MNTPRHTNNENNTRVIYKGEAEALDACIRLQGQTQAALARMQQQCHETQAVGASTLEELQTQRQTLSRIGDETNRLHNNLDQTEKLQNKLSRWTLTFHRRRAKRQVQREKQAEARQQARHDLFQGAHMNSDDYERQRLVQARERRHTQQAWNDLTNLTIESKEKEQEDTASAESLHSARPVFSDGSTNSKTSATICHETLQQRLDDLETQDKEMDEALDGLGLQVDGLLRLAKAQQQEIHAQAAFLTYVQDDVDTAYDKQRVVNHRAKGFLLKQRR